MKITSSLLLWVGLTIVVSFPYLGILHGFAFLGAVIMIIGAIMLLLGK